MSNHDTFMMLPSLVRQTLDKGDGECLVEYNSVEFNILYDHIIAQQEKIESYASMLKSD